ncbi:phage tail protein, partial [Lactobacillus amylolyticus]|uniref:phage tail protein n=1 Tax=Lactobacillus amylolyticus TaxID=83683 RepID=UPI002491800A
MELESLETLFKVNWDNVKEQLQRMQEAFQQFGDLTANTAQQSMQKTEQAMDLSEGLRKIQEEIRQVNQTISESFSKMSDTTQTGSEKISQSAGRMFSTTKQKVSDDLESVVQTINSKMEQAKAAQAKINELLNQKNSLSTAQQSGTQGVKLDNQIASAQAKMVHYQNQAKVLAQQMRSEFDAIPDSFDRIKSAMAKNEGQIETLSNQLKRLQAQYADAENAASVRPNNSKLQRQMTTLERSIMSTSNRMDKLISNNDELAKSYAYIEDRVQPLKAALDRVDTSMDETSTDANHVSTSMDKMGASASHASTNMSKMSGGGFFSKITSAISKATNGMNMFGNKSEESMDRATNSSRRYYSILNSIKMQLMFLPSMLLVYGLLWNGISSLATSTAQAFEVNKKFAASLETIKDNLLTAFYPIYSYVLPAVNALMTSLEKATSWLAQFTSALTGMSFGAAKSGAQNLKEQVNALNDTSSASSKASNAVKEANQQIKEANAQQAKAVKEANEQIKESNAQQEAQVKATNAQITASNKAAQTSYENEKAAAEALANSLMGFDELNVLDKDSSSSDVTKPTDQALETYTAQPTESTPESTPLESTTDDSGTSGDGTDTPFTPSSSVFDSAADAANRLKKILGELFDPMKEAWADKGQEVMDAAKYAAGELGKDFEDVGKSFMSVWTNGTGKETMENLLQLVADLLNIIGDIGKAFDEAWRHGNAGTKLIQTIFDSLNDVLVLLHDIATSFRQAFNDNNLGEQIISNIIKLLTTVASTVGTIAKAFDDAWKHGNLGTEVFKAILTAANNVIILINDIASSFQKAFSSNLGVKMFSDILTIAKDVFQVIGNFASQFDKAWQAGNTGTGIFKAILGIIDVVLDDLKDMADYTVAWSSKLDFTPLLESIQTLLNAIKPITKDVFDGLKWGYENILLPLAKFTITELVPNFLNLLAAALKAVNSIITAAKPAFKWIWDSFLEPLAEWTGGVIIDVLKKLTGLLTDISDWVDKHQKAVETAAKVIIGMFTFKIAASGLSEGVGFLGKIADYAVILSGKKGVLSAFFGKITGISDLKNAWTDMKNLWELSKMGWGSFAGKIVEIWEAFKNWSVWSKLAAAGQVILNAAMDLNPYVLLASAIAAIVVALSAWYLSDKKNRDKVVQGWNSFKTTMSKTWDSLKKAVGKWASDTAETVDDGLTNAQKALKKDGDAFSKEWSSLWTGLTKWLSKNWEGVSLVIVSPVLGGLKLLYDNNPKFSKWVDDLWSDTQKSFKTFEKNWNSYWDGIDDDLQNAWDTASKNTKSAWDNISSKIESASKQARSDAKSAWDNLQNDTSDAWNNISSNTQNLWNTVSSKISSFANNAKDNATNTWDSLKNNTSNIWNDVSSNTQSLWGSISSNIGNSAGNAKNNALNAWNDLKNSTSDYFSSIQQAIGSTWNNIISGARSLGDNIASGIRGGMSAVRSAMDDLKDSLISPVKSAVNKIKDGINWVLDKVGAGGLSWGWFNWANGTANHPGGLAMVNDENSTNYRESYQLPNGKQGIFPAVRNLVLPLPAGTQIKSASATQEAISGLFPHYAGGIGSFDFDFSGLDALSKINWGNLFGGIGSGIGDIWDGVTDEFDSILSDVTHPKKLLDYMVNKFMSYDWGWTDTQTKLAKGSVNTLEDGLTSWAGNILKKFGIGTQTGPGATGWTDAVKKALAKLGLPTTSNYISAWVKQIQTESGGNEKAMGGNDGLSDGNAEGLLQVKPGTFAAYHLSGYNDIWKGWDNMLAGINYAIHRYGRAGMLSAIGHGHGYENGGYGDQQGLYPLFEGNKPEIVLPLTNKARTLQLIKEAMNYIGENFT